MEPNEPYIVHGSVVQAAAPIEARNKSYTHSRPGGVTASILSGTQLSANFKRDIDVSWLGAAADTYHISGDINDYVIIDIPSVTVDIPNRNLQAFPYEEVSYFDNMQGSLVYQTFVGRPCHVDHQNSNPIEAKGVHFDSALQFVPAYNVWKIRTLAGFDRTKDAKLTGDILSGRRNGYSMGALVQNFVCSNCGQVEVIKKPCRCMAMGKGSIVDGRLVYQLCAGVQFFEQSSVEDPADPTALSDSVR
jgi:hypothetical protein